MFVIDRSKNECRLIDKKSFSELGFREREHLQEWIAKFPAMLGEELLIIQKEFDGFQDTKERLDLLAVDKSGNLVIIENKLDDSGKDVVWQALKYASYCSSLTKDDIKGIYQNYLNQYDSGKSAASELSGFFRREYDEIILNRGTSQRILFVAANFRKEVTSTALWLLNFNVNVQCFRVTPYQKGEDLFLDIEQIIPVKEAEAYLIKYYAKTIDVNATEADLEIRNDIRQRFWTEFLKVMNTKSDLFRNISPGKDNWLSASVGIGGVAYNLVLTKAGARVEVYIDTATKERNKAIFDYLFERKNQIEADFGEQMIWLRYDDKDASKITFGVDGNYFDQVDWVKLIDGLISNTIKMSNAVGTHLKGYKSLR